MESKEKHKQPFVTLDKVIIQGFRSIEYMELAIPKGEPVILTGKNECGKSNILKAIELLNTQDFTIDDKKQGYEKQDNCVKFECTVNWENIVLENAIREAIHFTDKDNNSISKKDIDTFISYIIMTITDMIEQTTVIIKPKKTLQITPKVLKLNIYKLTKTEAQLNNYSYSYETDNNDTITDIILNKEKNGKKTIPFSKLTQKIAVQILKEKLPKIILWNYDNIDNSYSIDIEQFTTNPDRYNHYTLLKNLFLMAGIPQETYRNTDNWLSSDNRVVAKNKTELEKVNKILNEYIKNSWKEYAEKEHKTPEKEYKLPEFELYLTPSKYFTIIIKDENNFTFNARSDGFKKFIHLLLTTIAPIEKKHTNRQTVLLIDEPETSLHPSAAKDLHNKLKELAKKTPVIYATHSISMVDTITISNNKIVKKIGENTKIPLDEEEARDKIYPPDLVYEAMGFSILDILKPQNIIFEGHYDRKLFEIIMKGNTDWDSIGKCVMNGVRNIEFYMPFFELSSTRYIIISDADDVAYEEKRKFEKNYGEGMWYTYKDLGLDHITGEDFLKNTYIQERLQITDEIPKYNKMATIQKQLENIKSKIPNITKKNDCKDQLWAKFTKDVHIEEVKEYIHIDEVQKVLNKIKEKLKAQILTV